MFHVVNCSYFLFIQEAREGCGRAARHRAYRGSLCIYTCVTGCYCAAAGDFRSDICCLRCGYLIILWAAAMGSYVCWKNTSNMV